MLRRINVADPISRSLASLSTLRTLHFISREVPRRSSDMAPLDVSVNALGGLIEDIKKGYPADGSFSEERLHQILCAG